MRCQTCGEDLREGARFCPTCGTPSQPTAAPAAPTVQIRRSGGESVAGPSPAESVPAPVSRAPEPTARPARDPGAGYDPVGPTRPATQAPPRPVVTASAGGAGGSTMMAGLTTPTSGDFRTLFERLQRLARLDTSVFAEVYADTAATIPVAVLAAVVFVISGLGGMLYIASGIGFDVYGRIAQSSGEFFLRSVIIGTIFGIAMWVAWSAITALLLRQMGKVEVEIAGIARVLGLALIPLVLALLLFLTDIYLSLSWIALGAVVTLALIGVLEAVDVRPGVGWVATLVGFAVFVIVLEFLGHDLRDWAPGFFVAG